jgi:hypothetical protein
MTLLDYIRRSNCFHAGKSRTGRKDQDNELLLTGRNRDKASLMAKDRSFAVTHTIKIVAKVLHALETLAAIFSILQDQTSL